MRGVVGRLPAGAPGEIRYARRAMAAFAFDLRTLPRWWPAPLAFLLALALRLPIWIGVKHAGHADPAFYVGLAKNLVEGRGFVIDYIWHFLIPEQTVTHFAPDYWQPLPSVLMAGPMLVRGAGAKAAVLASVLVSALSAALAAGHASRTWGPRGPLAVGAFVAVLPQSMAWSLQADSVAPAALALLGAYVLADRSSSPAGAGAAGFCLGLAVLCRLDSVAAAVPLFFLSWSNRPAVGRVRPALLFVGFSALTPLLFDIFLGLLAGNPSTTFPRSGRMLFLVEYEDLFRLGGPDPARYFALMLGEHLARFAGATAEHVAAWSAETRHFGWPVVALLAWGARRERFCAAVLLHFGLLLLFYSVVSAAGVTGGFRRGSGALVPVLVLSAARALPPLNRMARLAGAVALVWLVVAGVRRSRDIVARNNRIGEETATLAHFIQKDGEPRAVVMTRSPWQLALHDLKAVQIPNGDERAISSIITHYGVTHVVAPDPALRPRLGQVMERDGWAERKAPGGERVYSALPRRRSGP